MSSVSGSTRSTFRSVQEVTILINTVSYASATITAVTVANTHLSYSGLRLNALTVVPSDDNCNITITSTTTVKAERGSASGALWTTFYVVEGWS